MSRRRRKRKFVKGSAKKIAIKAYKKVKKLERKVGHAELKVSVGSDIGAQIINTGTITHLTDIAEGLGQGERDGTMISVAGIEMRAKLESHATPFSTAFRMVLFYDRRQVPDQATTVANFFEGADVYASYNVRNVGRFFITSLRIFCNFNSECIQFTTFFDFKLIKMSILFFIFKMGVLIRIRHY